MDVARVRGEGVLGDVGVVILAGGAGNADLAVFLGFNQGVVGEIAAVHVVCAPALHEVHGDGCEHGGGAALQEQHAVSLRHAHDLAEVGLRLLKDLQIHLGTVAHFHDGHAGAAVAEELLLHALQHGKGQHGRAGCKIVYAIHSLTSAF